ncbi:uncharacterized protein LOC125661500 isoform X2 [Ostrea edulis]|uniref:uncharacterized protein LOC125661500 isoform X2 n=1 Tax=Ostrea edulis TaxID=37623 RepID=UPI0024AF6674|nr:uncharacterized protein LOC125661500 isoform X2 [Ostrea edulis]
MISPITRKLYENLRPNICFGSMGPIRMKYILLIFIFSHHIVLTTSAITNGKLLMAAGIVTAALMSSPYGYDSSTPSSIALLTAILFIALIPTQSDADRGSTMATDGNRGSLSQTEGSTCTRPGYTIDPVLGCIKTYISMLPPVTHSQMTAQCASDGGELLLVNSAAENTALVNLMNSNGVSYFLIQGSRVTATDPWLTDSGQPLPYIASIQGTPNLAGQTKLLALDSGLWQTYFSTSVLEHAVCEIL